MEGINLFEQVSFLVYCSGRGVRLTTDLYPVVRLRISGAVLPPSYIASWIVQECYYVPSHVNRQ